MAGPISLRPEDYALNRHLSVLILLGAAPLLACGALSVPPTPSPTPAPATPAPTVPPTPTIPPSWTSAVPGVEVRALPIPATEDAPQPTLTPTPWASVAPGVEAQTVPIPARWRSEDSLAVVLRIDPAHADIRLRYDPDNPQRVAEWTRQLGSGPFVVMNAGYFQQDYTSAGLVVADGQRFGLSFGDTDGHAEGMFSLSGGVMRIRALAAQPYDPAEPLDQAVQGLPMLVDGGAPSSFELPEQPARRTAIGLDSAGRLLLIHVYNIGVTLPRLRDWLIAQPDLGITTALNLDGGGSTGLVINGGPWPLVDDSISKVPSVLIVTLR